MLFRMAEEAADRREAKARYDQTLIALQAMANAAAESGDKSGFLKQLLHGEEGGGQDLSMFSAFPPNVTKVAVSKD